MSSPHQPSRLEGEESPLDPDTPGLTADDDDPESGSAEDADNLEPHVAGLISTSHARVFSEPNHDQSYVTPAKRRNRIQAYWAELHAHKNRNPINLAMSRGGRGGFGAARNPLRQMGWDIDESAKLDSKPSELFPPYVVPVAAPLTESEKRDIALYREFRDAVHHGPLYTRPRKRDINESSKVYGEDQDNARFTAKSKADFDPFNDGVPTFSKKYEQKQNELPLFTGEFDKRFFPEELWSTLEGKAGEKLKTSASRSSKKLNIYLNATPAERQARLDALEEELKKEEAGDNDTVRDEDELPEEEEDIDYEDDEDEMGGDYDAEQYFDGGDGDEDNDDGGGGGDDY